MQLIQFEHKAGRDVFINPALVTHVIRRDANEVSICFGRDDFVPVKGEAADVAGKISAALEGQ